MSLNKTAIFRATEKAQGIHDPAVERHRDELFGTPTAADPTPPDQRNPGPGRVLVEWIGESGPLASARLNAAVELGLIPRAVVEAWTKYHGKITTRVPGLTHHTMSVERDGMSETYTWGPWDYVQSVTIKDADTLLSGSFGYQFRIVGYEGKQPADMSVLDLYVAPAVAKGAISPDAADKIAHICIDEKQPEMLTTVTAGGRMGTWTSTR